MWNSQNEMTTSASRSGGESASPALPERIISWTPSLVAGMMLGWALAWSVYTSHEAQWPGEWDILRDISVAQAIYDGRYPEDPIQLGDVSWYNPLTGAILAVRGLWSSQSLPRLAIVMGPYVNLLAPLLFYAMLATFFGRGAGLVGLALYLFVRDPAYPFWISASYSPWFMAPIYSMGLLFAVLATYGYALRSRAWLGYAAAGLLLGVTFTSHTAPALVGGGAMLLMTFVQAIDAWRGERNFKAVIPEFERFLLLLTLAFLISLPYSLPILWRYQFRVQNPWPSLYATPYVELQHLSLRLREALNWRTALAGVGVVALAAHWRRHIEARLVLCWGVVVTAFMTQHYLWQYLLTRGIVVSAFVPGHHAAIHLSAFRNAACAVGMTTLAAIPAWGLQRLSLPGSRPWNALAQGGIPWLVVAATVTLLYANNPYGQRVDFQPPQRDMYQAFHEQGIPMYEWILHNTPPDAVFLCNEESVGLTVVMPAGRKLVASMLLYTNPFTHPAPRADAQAALFEAAERGDKERFCEYAARYPSLFLLLREEASPPSFFFEEAYRAGGLIVYQQNVCEP